MSLLKDDCTKLLKNLYFTRIKILKDLCTRLADLCPKGVFHIRRLHKGASFLYNNSNLEVIVMDELNIVPGNNVIYQKQHYQIKSILDLERVLLVNPIQGNTVVAEISLLELPTTIQPLVAKSYDLSTISEENWQIAKQREEVLAPLAKASICTYKQIQKVGKILKLKRRQVYYLLNNYRTSGYKLGSLVPKKTCGGLGKSRLNEEIEQVISSVIKKLYLSPQKIKVSAIIEEIHRLCFNSNIKPPSAATIRNRVTNCYTDQQIVSKREGFKKAKAQFSPIIGSFPQQQYPLQVYQIDHTPVDLIIVDELYRSPIGRPYLTVAIDVFSRCIAGFCLTLEPPSAVSVGLCLTHAVLDKNDWLAERKIATEWPIWGKPDCIYVDNAKEFHSEALQRGCEAHGIKISYRPVAQPHFGGIVERVIGTLMQLVHQLPGTTFSNIRERGQYNSEQQAVLTLAELEQWLTIAITKYYHNKLHEGILLPPIEKYRIGILGDQTNSGRGYPIKICNKQGFLIDFLPIEHRSIQRDGFTLDHVVYYSNKLTQYIANRKRQSKFLIRRDPRDLSKIYVLEPNRQGYLEVPYRTLSRPSISLWEHRQALKYLREQGLLQVAEDQVFKAVDVLRKIAKEAGIKSKAARKQLARQPRQITQLQSEPELVLADYEQVLPFEDLELW